MDGIGGERTKERYDIMSTYIIYVTDAPVCNGTEQLTRPNVHYFCSRWTSLVELSSGPAAQSRHHLLFR